MALKPTFFCQAVFHRTPGKRDINKPLSFPVNDRILIYDSQGCEAGEEANIKTLFNSVLEFTLQTRYRGTFPIVVVFTKLDTLHEKWVDKLEHELGEEMEDKEFDDAVDAAVEAQVQELCVEPLRRMILMRNPAFIGNPTSRETPPKGLIENPSGGASRLPDHLIQNQIVR
ncbi:hypothetical protein B0H11DRAFT_1901360 [Mycena galericulata]|nr:hypothetical protein B0H11DRAFT_1901360 [Mycena galericulata]